MNKKEIDNFLISIGGLVDGFHTDTEPIITSDFFSCGVGWYPLIKELIEELIKIGWDKRIYQIKEKFGGLRFYVDGFPKEKNGFDIVRKAEKKSFQICEICGEPGKLRDDLSWIRTLCDNDYKKANDKSS